MLEKVTKKNIQELLNLVNEYGYWSEQVAEYNSKFSYNAMVRLQDKTQAEMMKVDPNYRLRR